MKKFFYSIVLCIMCASCDIEDPIKLDRHLIEVDYQAQDVIINADEKILTMLYDYSESDVDHSNNNANLREYRDGSIKYIECEWFKMALDASDPYHICISLDENRSNKDRKVKIRVSRRIGTDEALIVQKRKPSRQ